MKTCIKYLYSIIFLLAPVVTQAQCAMCRAVLESEGSQSAAEGINDGIIYLMVFPYILIGSIVFLIYRSFRKNQKAEDQS